VLTLRVHLGGAAGAITVETILTRMPLLTMAAGLLSRRRRRTPRPFHRAPEATRPHPAGPGRTFGAALHLDQPNAALPSEACATRTEWEELSSCTRKAFEAHTRPYEVLSRRRLPRTPRSPRCWRPTPAVSLSKGFRNEYPM